jgi:hypothetical protein
MPLEFPWMMLALSLLLPLIGVGLWISARKRHMNQPPPCSIVLLLRGPREMNAQVLADLLSKETGRTIAARETDANLIPDDSKPADDTVIGVSPHFVAVVGRTYFMVHNLAKPYRGEVGFEHEAWLSMDILHPQAVSRENYQLVGRVLSHLVGNDCLALYHPPFRRCVPCTAKTAELLRGEDPIKVLFDEARSGE